MKVSSAIILASTLMSSTSARDEDVRACRLKASKAPGSTKSPKALTTKAPKALTTKSPKDLTTKSPKASVKVGKGSKSSKSEAPSMVPSNFPSMVPSNFPSMVPSDVPSDVPSMVPSDVPSDVPSMVPSDVPSDVPSSSPTGSRTLWCFDWNRRTRTEAVNYVMYERGVLAGNRKDYYEDNFAIKYGAPLWQRSQPKKLDPFFWAGGACGDGLCPAFVSDRETAPGEVGIIKGVNHAPDKGPTPKGGAFYEISGKWYTPEDQPLSCWVKPMNIALDGTASQSSNYANPGIFDASKANNGIKNQNSSDIQHTKEQDNPWWKLKLDSLHTISDILIYNRFDDCCKDRIVGFTVSIVRNGVNVWQYTDSSDTGLSMYHIQVPRSNAAKGDAIVVQIPDKSRILHMSEVEVYGVPQNARRPQDGCNTPGTVASTTVDSELLEEMELF